MAEHSARPLKGYSFLSDIPAELRLQIYRSISPPLSCNLASYRGLFLTCRQIYVELSYEVIKNMGFYLSMVEAKWNNFNSCRIRIKQPETVRDTDHLTVSIPLSIIESAPVKFADILAPIMPLYIASLEIHAYEDKEDKKRVVGLNLTRELRDVIQEILGVSESVDRSSSTRPLRLQADCLVLRLARISNWVLDYLEDGTLAERWDISLKLQSSDSRFSHTLTFDRI